MIFVDELRPLLHYDVTENEDSGSGYNKKWLKNEGVIGINYNCRQVSNIIVVHHKYHHGIEPINH